MVPHFAQWCPANPHLDEQLDHLHQAEAVVLDLPPAFLLHGVHPDLRARTLDDLFLHYLTFSISDGGLTGGSGGMGRSVSGLDHL